MSQQVVLPMETFNKLVDYVQAKPYAEVANLIEDIRSGARLVSAPEESEGAEEASDE